MLLKRVLEATAGGVSRATQLEDLARWIAACPTDDEAHALVGLVSGLQGARHFGTPDLEPDEIDPSESWWSAPPAPVDTTLRHYGRTASPGTPKAVPDRRKEKTFLRRRQEDRRRKEDEASRALLASMTQCRPLDERELRVLLRLLSRALTTRRPAQTTIQTVRGRLRLRIEAAEQDTLVRTTRGTLLLEGHHLEVTESGAPRTARPSEAGQEASP